MGDLFTCQRYTDLHEQQKPEWGIASVSSENDQDAGDITQNILCCKDLYKIGGLDPFTEWGNQDKQENVEEDDTKAMKEMLLGNAVDAESETNIDEGNAAVASQNIEMQQREQAVIAAFQPIWFENVHGWSGGSYEDADSFCERYNHMVLCP